jgi:hypothetical protein
MSNKKNELYVLTVMLLVSISLIYITYSIGYCKDVLGDMIIFIVSIQCSIYSIINIYKNLKD